MDDRQFDDLTRRWAGGLSRRTAVKAAVAGLLGALGTRAQTDAQVSQAQCGNTICKNNPGKCAAGCVCCIYSNGNSRCRPPGNCGSGGEERCPSGQVVDPIHGCVTPTTTTTFAPTTTTTAPTTTAPPTTSTTTMAPTTTTTTAPGCPDGSTNCNGVCCPSPCECLQRLDGGLSCVNETQGRGCSGGEAGRCDDGFACIFGTCRGICGATVVTTTTPVACQPLGTNCAFGSNTCCQQPEPSMCAQVFDGGQTDPPTLCCRPSGGNCSSFADCCDGVPCTGGKCLA